VVVANPGEQVEPCLLSFVEHQVEQDGGHTLACKELHRIRRRRCDRGAIAEVVEVDPQLLLHGCLVLDHQHCRSEDLGRPVDLEARRQRRQPDITISRN